MSLFHQHLDNFRSSMSSEETSLLLEKLQERVPDHMLTLVKRMVIGTDPHDSMMAAKEIIQHPVEVLVELVGSLDGLINEEQTDAVRMMFESISN